MDKLNDLKLRKSSYADLPVLMQLVADAQKALAQLGIDQWQDGYPSEDIIRNDIDLKQSYLLEDKKGIVAMAALIFNNEPSYNVIEGAWLTEGRFGVIHRMAVDSRYKRQGIARHFLQELEQHCLQNHIFSLKIDTHDGNTPMQQLLIQTQYNYCGIIWLDSGKERRAYEKVLTPAIVSYQPYASPIGELHLYAVDSALLAIGFTPKSYPIIQQKESSFLKEVTCQFKDYFAGKRTIFDLSLQPTGTPFQQKVWHALQTIPYGETRTYGQIATQIGNPKACRAVGLANNRNPIPVIIPCHRVIGSNGKLVGYAGGLQVKEMLLKIENERKRG